MLMPSIFGENLFDDFFNDFPFYDYDKEMKNTEKKLYGRKASHVMKTDIRELDNGYEVVVDLPGFTKDEVQATLENGYLTISAEKGLDKDEKEKENGRYIRKERYAGACRRSFYVGEDITEEDIKAELKDGYLTVTSETSKEDKTSKDDTSRYICRERFYSTCSRNFYVGKELTQEDIKAKFENGVLILNVPKKEALPQREEERYISIL